MDRRTFLRRIAISGVMGIAAVGGVAALIEKLGSTAPAGAASELTLPSLLTQTSEQSASLPSSQSTQAQSSAMSSGSAGSTTTASKTNSSSRSSSSSTTAQGGPPSGYILLAPLSALNGKTYAYFNHPTFGSSIVVNYNGTWKAFSAICTHAGCSVNYTSSQLYCPCHAGYFSAANGAVTGGPPPSRLPEYDIKVYNNSLYVGNAIIN
ncbi:MAG TPA: Rieske (2Fe-2S) protein [Nitrososphaerales archaeon]|nr:Rieske (2Fe-2S) protein [Nitrososphaerales archaeon]